uniref:Uncharacterized protein n=1 Tax=Amphimedon queenslandica TaxID=400682 RepID=A0A1X7V7Z8_AMPQE
MLRGSDELSSLNLLVTVFSSLLSLLSLLDFSAADCPFLLKLNT